LIGSGIKSSGLMNEVGPTLTNGGRPASAKNTENAKLKKNMNEAVK
jgi:hypothetical protein